MSSEPETGSFQPRPSDQKEDSKPSYRVDKDSLGTVEVPIDALWGAQTQRSIENFRIGERSVERMPMPVIRGLAIIKHAAARVNEQMGRISAERSAAIQQAATEVVSGLHDDQFPLVIWQTGSGTQTNMNVNEVVANRACQILKKPIGDKSTVHPNDHVNCSQSSNDSFPTAMHIATVIETRTRLLPGLRRLHLELQQKSVEFADIIKIGRTHCQDATPVTVGQVFSGYARMVELAVARISSSLEMVYELAQGGTAVGTGINSPMGFAEAVAAEIAAATKEPFRTSPNKFEALATHDALVEFSGSLATVAGSLFKIASDVKLLGSGPSAGLAEFLLPENEPGSSIMPGKVNPTQCEALLMVCTRVHGNHAQVMFAGSQGQFELNVFKPAIIASVLQSIELLGDAATSFATKCISGIRVNVQRLKTYVARSYMLATALNPHIGYDKAAEIAKYAHIHNVTVREAAVEHLKLVKAEDFDAWVKPEDMTHPFKKL